MNNIENKLKILGIILPKAVAPVANYLPYIKIGDIVYISGQLPNIAPEIYTGKLGSDVATEEGIRLAANCVKNIITQIKVACDGDLDKVEQIVQIGVFVNAISDFKDHPKVANGASDLLVSVFGEKGKHSRFAVGVGSLPLNVPVEISAIVKIN